jgi:hypothetical protein
MSTRAADCDVVAAVVVPRVAQTNPITRVTHGYYLAVQQL